MRIKFIALLLILTFLLSGCQLEPTTGDITPAPTNTETMKPTSSNDEWLEAGIYTVGTEILAGEYFLEATGVFGGYFELKDANTGKIIANGSFRANVYVTVSNSQILTISLSRMTDAKNRKVEVEYIDGEAYYLEGMYKVGKDIKAGTYELICLESSDMGRLYYEILKDSKHLPQSKITSGHVKEATITVYDGQYLYVSNADIKFVG